MTKDSSDRTIVLHLLRCAVPERADEISELWERYAPAIDIAPSAVGATMNANRHRVCCDTKTIDLFWLLGFSAWRSIEVYAPALKMTMASRATIDQALRIDEELTTFERNYKERMAAVASLISANSTEEINWPPDIPRPQAEREGFSDPQAKAAFDLTALALAFALLHEFSHVMILNKKAQPHKRSEEELLCDVWARDFMTAKLAAYARTSGHAYQEVSQKRAMAMALAVIIFHAITPTAVQWGNSEYPPFSNRIKAIVGSFSLPSDSPFWVFTACLLVGIMRQEHGPLDIVGPTPQALAETLITRIR